MAGALFHILIPTEQHEIHLSPQHTLTCDCSTKAKHSNNKQSSPSDNTSDEKKPIFQTSISMKKVSTNLMSTIFPTFIKMLWITSTEPCSFIVNNNIII